MRPAPAHTRLVEVLDTLVRLVPAEVVFWATSTRATATIRERSTDKYSGPELATVDSTSGRATALLGAIGRIDADGSRVGRMYDVCASLT